MWKCETERRNEAVYTVANVAMGGAFLCLEGSTQDLVTGEEPVVNISFWVLLCCGRLNHREPRGSQSCSAKKRRREPRLGFCSSEPQLLMLMPEWLPASSVTWCIFVVPSCRQSWCHFLLLSGWQEWLSVTLWSLIYLLTFLVCWETKNPLLLVFSLRII